MVEKNWQENLKSDSWDVSKIEKLVKQVFDPGGIPCNIDNNEPN